MPQVWQDPTGPTEMLRCESSNECDLLSDVAVADDTQTDADTGLRGSFSRPVAGLANGFPVALSSLPGDDSALPPADADLIDFDAAGFVSSVPPARRSGWIASAALSVLIHGGLVALAVVLVARVTRPATIDFAYGDTGATYGISYRAGEPDRTPGWDGLARVVPPRPARGQLIPSPTDDADDAIPEMPPAAPVLPEPAEERISKQSVTDMPLPEFPLTKKLQLAEAGTKSEGDAEKPPVPAATQPIAQVLEKPAAQPAETLANEAKADSPIADASTGANEIATTQASASASSANASQSANRAADAASGDNMPGGQGGATTGVGGTAASGVPGIPAGLRDGQRLPAPVYPEISRRRGEQGLVLLEIQILADGSVGDIRVVNNTGHPRLATAAVDCFRGYRFRPAMSNGVAVSSTLRKEFSFYLR